VYPTRLLLCCVHPTLAPRYQFRVDIVPDLSVRPLVENDAVHLAKLRPVQTHSKPGTSHPSPHPPAIPPVPDSHLASALSSSGLLPPANVVASTVAPLLQAFLPTPLSTTPGAGAPAPTPASTANSQAVHVQTTAAAPNAPVHVPNGHAVDTQGEGAVRQTSSGARPADDRRDAHSRRPSGSARAAPQLKFKRVLGRGATGKVYLATLTRNGLAEDIAVKQLVGRNATSAGVAKMLRVEVRCATVVCVRMCTHIHVCLFACPPEAS